jgi:3-phosphoshikimate 1-carboxyvinyltransferase
MADIEIEKSRISGEFESPYIGNYSGDYSFAGMFFARAAINSSVICTNLNPRSEQNGTVVLDILKSFGAKVKRAGDSVNVSAQELKGTTVDISEFPQIAPVIALLALFAKGKTRISGFSACPELVDIITENLSILGARCEIGPNDLWIWPQKYPSHAVLNARNNPYMAMALILISTHTEGKTFIRNIDGLLQRYPEFEKVFTDLGGKCRVCQMAL